MGLGYSHFKKQKQNLPFGLRRFLAHLACVFSISLCNIAALHGYDLLSSQSARLILRLILFLGIFLLASACIPVRAWISTIRETGMLWVYSAFTGLLAWCLRFPLQSVWDTSSTAPGRVLQVFTFHSVRVILRFFLPDIYVDAPTFIIGTPRFSIFVAEACSGLEGIGLVLAFAFIWLWYFRKESYVLRALLLVPCALAAVLMLNVVRISALVLIGNAGYGEIAMVGFHSQAGWIAFTAVAFAFSVATRTIPWMRRVTPLTPDVQTQASSEFESGGHFVSSGGEVAIQSSVLSEKLEETGEPPASAAYLVPFLAILAASFASKAVSGYFEWLYPLRFVVAAIALWHYWPELKKINWRFDWLAPITGAGVFLLWLAPSLWHHSQETTQLGTALAALSPAARWSWIAFRVAAAVITVPIAEELAFRGYLARRLVNREFDTVPFSAVSVVSIALSSAIFGAMHGHHWITGILSGLIFAGLMKWKGRLSDAIVAHATTNLLLAIWVISRGDFGQW